MIELPTEEIAQLCRKYAVKRLWVFGSAVTEGFDPDKSDVDFLVEYPPGIDLGPWMRDYFDLQLSLEALLGRKVDLVDRGAIKNPRFLQNVTAQEKLLYAA